MELQQLSKLNEEAADHCTEAAEREEEEVFEDACEEVEEDSSRGFAACGPLAGLPDLVPEVGGGRVAGGCYGGLEYEERGSLSHEEEGEGGLAHQWRERAEQELQEKAEWRKRDIQALRDLVEREENFNCDVSDAFLIRFLRAKKYDYEAAFKMLQRYLGIRARSPANFEKCLPSRAEKIFNCNLQNVLPHRDSMARRVFIFRAGMWDTSITTPQDIFATNFMCLEVMGREPKTQIAGLVALVDMAGFGWDHVMQLSLEYVKDVVAMVQNSFPIRFREIHIVNESYLFDVVFALVKPLLTEKIRERIRFHGADHESLHRCLPRSILPEDYGGEQPPFNNTGLKHALEKMEDHFLALQTYGYRDNAVPSEVYDRETHPFPAFCMSGTLPE